jgi:dihydroflavonol-4-reductase
MKVLVTGANGHLGTSLTELLVQSGYQVRASVRGASDEQKVAPLKKLGVELVEADVLDAAAMEKAAEGVEAMFHLAAVFRLVAKDPENDVIRPAVQGAQNAIRAAAKAGLKRVVLTSSTVALGGEHKPDRALDERDWNEKAVDPYAIAKTRAEKLAWSLSKELKVDLVCVNPSALTGPGFSRHTPITFQLASLAAGKIPVAPPFMNTYADVRDVAKGHLLALENPKAFGRYLLTGHPVRFIDVGRTVKKLRPQAKVPTRELAAWMFPMVRFTDWVLHKVRGQPRQLSQEIIDEYGDTEVRFSSARARTELGWQVRPFEDSVRDTLDWLDQHQIPTW